MNAVWVFLGAGLGGTLRYVMSNWSYGLLGRHFPWGTLFVNASGSFIMGVVFVLLMNRYAVFAPQLRLFLLVGFLGGYTTFSSFSIETWNLFESGAWLSGSVNIFLNIVLCLGLIWLGIMWGRQL
ncbi:MAG: fluoride efflux transporter CrcB [Legionellales bacterium]|nr:fluoride efflux transporter CrcB [Legionellales bacterium]